MKAICNTKKKKQEWSATDIMQGTKIEQHIVLLKCSPNDNETYAGHHSIARILIVPTHFFVEHFTIINYWSGIECV